MRRAWGKTHRSGGSASACHPLAHHSIDVAAVFLRMLRLPVVRNRLESAAGSHLTEVDCQRLACLAFLHDIGKLHPGFQAKGWPQGTWPRSVRGHTLESWAFVDLACKWSEHPFHRLMLRLLEWGASSVLSLLAAMFAHHGRPVGVPSGSSLNDWNSPPQSRYDWRKEAEVMGNALGRWFDGAFEPSASDLPDAPRFHHAIAGFAALADWIGSNTDFFPFDEPFSLDYHTKAHQGAERALTEIRLEDPGLASLSSPTFQRLTGFLEPNPPQAVVGAVPQDAGLVILEAETGSGKTEAALWRFTQLLADGRVSGLYFAVPTRAAAKQLQGRINDALKNSFGAAAPEAVLAIPGTIKAGDFKGQRLPDWRVLWEDADSAVPRRWAAEHATRFLAATVAVGTVDQALLAGLQVKHAHMRGSALSRSLLVVDEVHASDAYMIEVLDRLLKGHLATGGYAMLMSATLGSKARTRWTLEAEPNPTKATKTPYPAVWVNGESAPRPVRRTGKSKTVHLKSIPTMAPKAVAECAIEAAQCRAKVLVIRNTVKAAVETWRMIDELGAGPMLMQVEQGPAVHHSRFAAEDRALLDRAVERVLAPNRNVSVKGCVVVGTQTLEQSLDIDADILITDLCPIDVLLQRIGRLHRHDLQRPEGFDQCRALVLFPERGLDRLTEPKFDNGLGAWKSKDGGVNGIYRDLASLELTRRQIEQHHVWRIPEMNRQLVEAATHPRLLADLIAEKGPDWERYAIEIGGAEAAKAMMAHNMALDRERDYLDCGFPDSDERVMTRLGEEGVVLNLRGSPIGPFGRRITRIALPAHWSQGLISEDEVKSVQKAEGTVEIEVGDRLFHYSRAGLKRQGKNEPNH